MTKILIDRAVVEQALEMLNRINAADDNRDFLTEDEAVCTIMAIDELDAAICAALEQPQVKQEPTKPKCVAIIEVFDRDWRMDYLSLPVGRHKLYAQEYSYTHPQPPRHPLTNEQIAQICGILWSGGWREKAMQDFARAIEAAHGIKEQK